MNHGTGGPYHYLKNNYWVWIWVARLVRPNDKWKGAGNLERVGKSKRIYRGLHKKFILIFHMQITVIMNKKPRFVTGIIWSKNFWNDLTFKDMKYTSIDIGTYFWLYIIMINTKLTLHTNSYLYIFRQFFI